MIKNYPTVDDDNELLFEVLKPAGFTTIGIVEPLLLLRSREVPRHVRRREEHRRRPDAHERDAGRRRVGQRRRARHDHAARTTTSRARASSTKTNAKLEELATSKQKFAMVVHLFEPHSTYMEHDGMPITEQRHRRRSCRSTTTRSRSRTADRRPPRHARQDRARRRPPRSS